MAMPITQDYVYQSKTTAQYTINSLNLYYNNDLNYNNVDLIPPIYYTKATTAGIDITKINWYNTLNNTTAFEYIPGNYASQDLYINGSASTYISNDIYTTENSRSFTTGSATGINWISFTPPTREEQLRQMLKQKLTPQILFKRNGLSIPLKDPEKRARETLKNIVGEDRFKRYLKHGFLTLKGKSGLIYQIFPGHEMTKVWKNGEFIEKMCVVFVDSSVPPTDSVIMRMLVILDDEDAFRKRANVFPVAGCNYITNNNQCLANVA